MGNLAAMAKQVAALQKKMNEAQAELSAAEYTGEAGGGLVTVLVKGTGEVHRLNIKPEALTEDAETLSDLVATAVNRALTAKETAAKARLQEIGAGVLPGGLKIPGMG